MRRFFVETFLAVYLAGAFIQWDAGASLFDTVFWFVRFKRKA